METPACLELLAPPLYAAPLAWGNATSRTPIRCIVMYLRHLALCVDELFAVLDWFRVLCVKRCKNQPCVQPHSSAFEGCREGLPNSSNGEQRISGWSFLKK
jgi:hypothetical protein